MGKNTTGRKKNNVGRPITPGWKVEQAMKMRKRGTSVPFIMKKLNMSKTAVRHYTDHIEQPRSQRRRGSLIIPFPDPLLEALIREHGEPR